MKKFIQTGSKSSSAMFQYTPSAGKRGTEGATAGPSGGRDGLSPRDMPKAIVKYEILETLEESPQLTSFLAKDPFSERAAVIRRHAAVPDAEEGDAPLDAIMDEARLLSRFNHQNILALYDAGGDDRRFWAAVERFEGETLESVLASRGKTIAARLSIMEQALSGLAAIHEAGVVIGDLHPKRVTIDKKGVAKITNLRGVGRLGADEALEREGLFAFPSPERLDGGALTKRSDVFSLGGIFHHLLLGQHPFPGGSPGATFSAPPAAPSSLNSTMKAFDGFFARALAIAPEARFEDFPEMLAAFREAERGRRSASARKEQLPVFAEKFFPKGYVLFHEGTKGDTAYILKEGRVGVSKKINEKSTVVAVLKPVNIFGEMAVLMHDKRRTATVTALDDIKVIAISYDQYKEILELTPTVIRTILGVLAKRLKKATEDATKG